MTVVTLLTTMRFHPAVLALVHAAAADGIEVVPSRSLDPRSALAFQWSYDLPRHRRAVREFCAANGIELVNPYVLGKWAQLRRLGAAGLRVPATALAASVEEAVAAAARLRYPVVMKPMFGLQSRDVVLVADETALREQWTARHQLVQEYLPEGGRCARLLVVGDRVVHAVTRVARDGFRATYAHGRLGTLEPLLPEPELEELALAACCATAVAVGGVDVVAGAAGPTILEVNHRLVDFTDAALHGPDAVARVAALLSERARRAGPRRRRARGRVVVATERPSSPSAEALVRACRAEGLDAVAARRLGVDAAAAILWRLSPTRCAAASAVVGALRVPALNGRPQTLWRQRTRLHAAGVLVPRARRATTLDGARAAATVVGYPLFLRDDGPVETAAAKFVARPEELEGAWCFDAPRVLDEATWAMQSVVRVSVAGGEVVATATRWIADVRLHDAGGVWRRARVTPQQAAAAIAACEALDVAAGVVELAGETVVRVEQGIPLASLDAAAREDACKLLAAELRRLIDGCAAVQAEPPVRLRIVVPNAYSGGQRRPRIWNVYALYRELYLRGHDVVMLQRDVDPELLRDADFVLRDPLYALGFGRRPDALDRLLYREHRDHAHLVYGRGAGRSDKLAMGRVARRLGLRAPAIYRRSALTPDSFPVVVKPVRDSLGRRVALARTPEEFERLPRRGMLVQEYIDSGTSYAATIRVVSVRDRVAAAAVFYNRHALCSNLARGGRVIALTGPGRGARVTAEEAVLLERLGIAPDDRRLPGEVAAMAATVGRHYAERGVQMLGQDYLADRNRKWYFLEVNFAFGVAVFNVTDGDGYPSAGRGLAHAGRVLERTLVEALRHDGEVTRA